MFRWHIGYGSSTILFENHHEDLYRFFECVERARWIHQPKLIHDLPPFQIFETNKQTNKQSNINTRVSEAWERLELYYIGHCWFESSSMMIYIPLNQCTFEMICIRTTKKSSFHTVLWSIHIEFFTIHFLNLALCILNFKNGYFNVCVENIKETTDHSQYWINQYKISFQTHLTSW